ncbi:iron reductase [Bradyrhizobium sp. CSA207]|uniref:iron reductase n=1 Tax=Bradyrhizobium sp. CSA207 TaxID=2698826 RepID=UPI0023B00ADC|nr:iron reductase [Bradyrhizobium sp. CSA207]MDE5445074.1 iron reductase [Bradyrhizobium sp. CSA207]
MGERERLIVDVVLAGLLFLVPAFLFHSDDRFAGSLAGFALGACAAALMILLLIYPLAKYSEALKGLVTRVMSMRILLSFHVYAGIVAAFVALLHTGHKFHSSLGIALIASMLTVVVTGFVGRYYLPRTAAEIRTQQSRLATLRTAYDRTALILSSLDTAASDGAAVSAAALQDVPLLQLVDGISDLEYAIESHESVKRVFMQWIGLHVVAAIAMYALLALHVAAEIYYGLRWLA